MRPLTPIPILLLTSGIKTVTLSSGSINQNNINQAQTALLSIIFFVFFPLLKWKIVSGTWLQQKVNMLHRKSKRTKQEQYDFMNSNSTFRKVVLSMWGLKQWGNKGIKLIK